MHKSLLVGLALAVSLTLTNVEAAKKDKERIPPSLDQLFQPEQMKEDLKILRQALEEGHPGLYLYTTKDDFDKKF